MALTGCGFIYTTVLSISCSARPDLSVQPRTLPVAVVGTHYIVLFKVNDAETPVGYVGVGEGQLPPGLKLVHAKGESEFKIIGVPEHKGEFPLNLLMSGYGTQCPGQSGEQKFNLQVK